MSRVVTLSILILTGMSLVSQTKVIKTNTLQAAVLELLYYENTEAQPQLVEENVTNTIINPVAATLPPALDPGKYPPFSCSKALTDLKRDAEIQNKDPNRGVLKVRRTITNPPFYISLHNKTFDTTRWG